MIEIEHAVTNSEKSKELLVTVTGEDVKASVKRLAHFVNMGSERSYEDALVVERSVGKLLDRGAAKLEDTEKIAVSEAREGALLEVQLKPMPGQITNPEHLVGRVNLDKVIQRLELGHNP